MNCRIDYKIPSVSHPPGWFLSLSSPLRLHVVVVVVVVSLQRAEEMPQPAADASANSLCLSPERVDSSQKRTEHFSLLFTDSRGPVSLAVLCSALPQTFWETHLKGSHASSRLSWSELQEFGWFLKPFFYTRICFHRLFSHHDVQQWHRGEMSLLPRVKWWFRRILHCWPLLLSLEHDCFRIQKCYIYIYCI